MPLSRLRSESKGALAEPSEISYTRTSYLTTMAREFKPIRFFVLAAIVAFFACGTVAFFTKRAEHGRTPEQRQAYALGFKAGEEAPAAVAR